MQTIDKDLDCLGLGARPIDLGDEPEQSRTPDVKLWPWLLAFTLAVGLAGFAFAKGYNIGNGAASRSVKQARQLAAKAQIEKRDALGFTRFIQTDVIEAAHGLNDCAAGKLSGFACQAINQLIDVRKVQVTREQQYTDTPEAQNLAFKGAAEENARRD